MKMLRRAVVAAVLVLATGSVVMELAGAGSVRADLDQDSALPGSEVVVTGQGWQPGTIVVLEVCGNEALDGAVDCAPSTATDIGVEPNGTFSTLLPVVVPPSPCPCVVQVSSTSEVTELRLPIEVIGAPVAPPLARATPVDIRRRLEVTSAELEGMGWKGWFGFSPERTLVLSIVNTGDVALHDIPVTAAAGRGDDPTGFVDAEDIDMIEPGERQTLRIPVTFDPLQFGDLSVTGTIGSVGEPVRFSAGTSNPPVLPVLLALVIAQWVLLRIRDRLRRRVDRDDDDGREDGAPGELALDVPESEPEVIDLREPAPQPVVEVVDLDGVLEEAPSPSDQVDSAEVRIAQRRAAQVAEALLAASAARSHALEEKARRAEIEANWRLLDALALLDRADARAREIQEEAANVARSTLETAVRRRSAPMRPAGLESGISNAVAKALADSGLATASD